MTNLLWDRVSRSRACCIKPSAPTSPGRAEPHHRPRRALCRADEVSTARFKGRLCFALARLRQFVVEACHSSEKVAAAPPRSPVGVRLEVTEAVLNHVS